MDTSTSKQAVKVSFIIPHKGRETLLEKTITSILSQPTKTVSLEVIVVTQNETLSDHIHQLAEGHPIKFLHQPNHLTISALRNHGVTQSQGDYLAFLDADVQLSDNWLESLLNELMQKPDIALISAIQKNSDQAPVLEQVRTALSNVETDSFVSFLPGRNLLISKQHFETVGGFPEHLVTCEDYYFTDRVNQLGSLLYSSKADYVHLGEDKDYKDMFKKEIWRGQSNLQSISGRKIPLAEYPSFLIPPVVLLLFISAMILASLEKYPLALASLTLSIFPVVLYSLRLFLKSHHEVPLWPIMKFYLLYFPARAIGTIIGIFKQVTTSDHK